MKESGGPNWGNGKNPSPSEVDKDLEKIVMDTRQDEYKRLLEKELEAKKLGLTEEEYKKYYKFTNYINNWEADNALSNKSHDEQIHPKTEIDNHTNIHMSSAFLSFILNKVRADYFFENQSSLDDMFDVVKIEINPIRNFDEIHFGVYVNKKYMSKTQEMYVQFRMDGEGHILLR